MGERYISVALVVLLLVSTATVLGAGEVPITIINQTGKNLSFEKGDGIEVILETSFEEEWIPDEDGDYYAPPGWDVDGICVSHQEDFPVLTHYWNDMHDYEYSQYNLIYDGSVSACMWWSDGYGEPEEVGYNQNEWLITPELDFSLYESVTLAFWSIYCWAPSVTNYYDIEISRDNGESWDTITDLATDPEWKLGGQISGWKDWNYYEDPIVLDLSNYAGEDSIRIAWHYYYAGVGLRGIWIVDDVNITGVRDTTSPVVMVKQPENAVYLNGGKLFPFFVPVIVGSVDVAVNASDDGSGVNCVGFYIDEELKMVDTTEPFIWTWNEWAFGKHTIKVIAYDNAGNQATKELTVWKFF